MTPLRKSDCAHRGGFTLGWSKLLGRNGFRCLKCGRFFSLRAFKALVKERADVA